MYPSNTKRKDKVPNQQQPETQAVSFTLKPTQLVSCRACPPPHPLHFSLDALIRQRLATGCANGWFDHLYLVRCTLLSLEQGGTTRNEMSPRGRHKCEILLHSSKRTDQVKKNQTMNLVSLSPVLSVVPFRNHCPHYYLENNKYLKKFSLCKNTNLSLQNTQILY